MEQKPFYRFNREERNHAALFYHLLLLPGNAESFIRGLLKNDQKINPKEFGIYFEYAYLRDYWEAIGTESTKNKGDRDSMNEHKRRFILDHIKPVDRTYFEKLTVKEFNGFFTGPHRASEDTIQNPGKWSIQQMNQTFFSGSDALLDLKKIANFKWSFNIKPDLVIHLDNSHAICIEIKMDSPEGFYPSTEPDTQKFNEVYGKGNWEHTRQTELQRYMFTQLLDVKTDFFFLVKPNQSQAKDELVRTITWLEVFDSLNPGEHPFVRESIDHLRGYVSR